MATHEDPFNLSPIFDTTRFELVGIDSEHRVSHAAYRAARRAVETTGGNCECCGQKVKVYRRSVYAHMARCLIWIVTRYAENGQQWVNLKEGPLFRGGDNTKLAYWRLTIAHSDIENLFKPTQKAVDFVARGALIPKYAYVYNGRVYGFSEERRSIEECFKRDFDRQDLTAAIAAWDGGTS